MKLLVLAALALLLVPAALAQRNATWVEVDVKHSWDRGMSNFCNADTQCLVHALGNPVKDGLTDPYFSTTNPALWPKCINDTQYLLDYYCDKGNWTTRTARVAAELAHLGETASPQDYTVYCANHTRVLNNYAYIIQGARVDQYLKDTCTRAGALVPCVNNICVLTTPSFTAFGTTTNIPVNHAQKSFLIAINKSPTLCDNVAGDSFGTCGQGVWHHPGISAVIFTPSGTLGAGADTGVWGQHKQPLTQYVFSVLHVPENPDRNFTYFPATHHFNNVYLAVKGEKQVFGFLEQGIIDVAPPALDYLGVQYRGITLGESPCLTIIKQYDDKAFCENQTGPGFMVIARHRPGLGASPLVQAWNDLTGKLRP